MATESWSQPAFRPPQIEHLISGVDRYNPQNLDFFEAYLVHQLQTGTYDCLANLAILKLYQFNPSEYNYNVVVNVLVKALTSAPQPDFSLCLALLGESPVPVPVDPDNAPTTVFPSQDPLINRLNDLSVLLNRCKFPLFWETISSDEYADVRQFTDEHAGFDDAIRQVVLRSVGTAFRSISIDRFGRYLNLSGDAVKSYVEERGWKVEGSKVTVPANADNEIKATVIREDLQLDQLTKFLAQAQTA